MTASYQLELFDEPSAHSLESIAAYLNAGARRPVEVVLTRNRSSMVSIVVPARGAVRVRMHEQFLCAAPAVIQALRRYLRTGRKDAWSAVSAFARDIHGQVADRPAPRPARVRGRVYDLGEIAREVNDEFFNGRIAYTIGWGRRVKRKRRRSIRFGSWHADSRTIRLNPILDDWRVPRDFIRYIVFHEMLHAVVPEENVNGRVYNHTRTFRRLENRYPNFPAMRRLCRTLLHMLA